VVTIALVNCWKNKDAFDEVLMNCGNSSWIMMINEPPTDIGNFLGSDSIVHFHGMHSGILLAITNMKSWKVEWNSDS